MNDFITNIIMTACQKTTVSLCCFDNFQMREVIAEIKRAVREERNALDAAVQYINYNF